MSGDQMSASPEWDRLVAEIEEKRERARQLAHERYVRESREMDWAKWLAAALKPGLLPTDSGDMKVSVQTHDGGPDGCAVLVGQLRYDPGIETSIWHTFLTIRVGTCDGEDRARWTIDDQDIDTPTVFEAVASVVRHYGIM